MPGLIDLHEVQTIGRSKFSHRSAIQLPVLIAGTLEVRSMGPVQLHGPGLVPQPVADVVHVTRIDQHVNAVGQQIWQELLVLDKPIPCSHKGKVHSIVAGAPFLVHAQLALHVGLVEVCANHVEVVAKTAIFAHAAHVIGILASELIGHDGHQVASIIGRKACRCVHHTTRGGVGIDTSVARNDAQLTGWHQPFHDVVVALADHICRSMTTLFLSTKVGHLWIPLVLLQGVCESIANGQAFQRDLLPLTCLVAAPNAVADGGHIVSCIGFSKDVEVGALVLLELSKELLQEHKHVVGHALLVVGADARREAHAGGLINPHDICGVVPRSRISVGILTVFCHFARPILSKERQLRGTARATREPHHQWCGRGVLLGLKQPEEIFGDGVH
mmetsp:Transcript_16576/g.36638  ORF Transcript_16576/g.36638 Transcript_16576/m.36638 type:complete len:388 (+) Transcript_16576:166-1329(+)